MGLMALVLATGLLWVTSVFAQNFTAFETGDELFDLCNVPTVDQRHFNDLCSGYIAGVSDVLNSQSTICTPKDATRGVSAFKIIRGAPLCPWNIVPCRSVL